MSSPNTIEELTQSETKLKTIIILEINVIVIIYVNL
jgi:hypothetical protein